MSPITRRNGGGPVGLGTGGLLLVLALVAWFIGWGTLAVVLAIIGVVLLFV